MQCIQQRTIKDEVVIKGIGLHSGEPVTLRLIPAESYEGIKFIKNGVYIPAHVENASGFDFSTTLEKDGQIVRTVEHLMAALYFTGIDNIYIEIQGEEIPILDGSAIEFIKHIKSAGIKILPEEKLFAVLKKEVVVKDGDKFIKGTPSDEFSATYHAQYNNSIIGNKKYTFSPSKELYENVAMARTYCFLEEVEMLQKMGLAKGGSLENAVVFDKDDVLNPEGLRFEDEPVKHKVLDLIGDLYLLGFPLIADVYSFKGGHRLNAQFVRKLIDEDAFDRKYFSELEGNRLKRAVA
ncbi:UDP-3-O-acyl-N-acetylglucosamine deacetylase [Persephonella sp. IF05-L8]|uniref:UDP-3-O-acyl-N-acetylglucosamine deacetylase n=1 Tax=Persephonella sp. IF05-L8 TaxID=1158338 RepID=UPI0004983D8B